MKNLFKLDISPKRIYGLDILRAFAIMFVLLAHNNLYLNQIVHRKYTHWFQFDGVSIFFVLSGFLIGGILLKVLNENPNQFSTILNFWKRRWFRTLPNYFLVLTFIVVYHSLFRDLEFSEVWKYYLFIQNFNSPHPFFFREAWSLSVEEWFYIIMPLITFAIIKFSKKRAASALLICALIIIAFSTYMRWYKVNSNEIHILKDWVFLIRTQVLTRLDSLMFGIIAAYLAFYKPNSWKKHKALAFWFGLVILILYKLSFYYISIKNDAFAIFNLWAISIGTALLLPYLSNLRSGSGKTFKIITYISLTSYSAYLINLSIVNDIVILNLVKILPQSLNITALTSVKIGLYWTLTFAGSILLYKYFELPVMNLRDKKTIHEKRN